LLQAALPDKNSELEKSFVLCSKTKNLSLRSVALQDKHSELEKRFSAALQDNKSELEKRFVSVAGSARRCKF
jgi:hypothetical protein